MPAHRPVVPRRAASGPAILSLAGALLAGGLASSAGPASAQQAGGSFRAGPCSGLLCDYIGGSQAPAAQPQKSLFREGECGGVLCEAIGGSQAPKHAEPPPPCGGGLLCDLMPYKMGVPQTAAEAARRQEAERQQAALASPVSAPIEKPRHRKRKTAEAGIAR